MDGGLGERGRKGAGQEGVGFVTHDFVGETRGAIAFVNRE